MSRRRLAAIAALVVSVVLVAAACGDDNNSSSSSDSGSANNPTINIGSQEFGESQIAAQLYGQVFADNGFKVNYKKFGERAAIYAAFDSGDINFVPEYAASALEFLNHNAGEATNDITTTVDKLNQQLEPKKLQALEPSKAVDSNSLVVTKETADKDHLTKISDLSEDMKLGGPQDCPTNAGCIPALKDKYGLDMSKNFVALDPSGPITKKALQNGDVDVAVIFSTDSSIAANDWVVLKDDKGIFLADNIVPVMSNELANNSEIKRLTNEVSALLTTENVTAMNKEFDVDKKDASAIARQFLQSKGLLPK